MSMPSDSARLLNLRQQRFVQEYLLDGVGAAAARRAGYLRQGAKRAAERLLRDERVLQAIGQERARRAAPMTRERAIEALRRIAEANVLDYVRPGADGALELDLWRLERDRAGAVKALSVVEKTDPASGAVTRTVSFTLADRSAALMKLLPMLKSPTEAEAEWRGWLKGAESMTEMTPEAFARFQAFRAERAGAPKGEAFNAVLDAFWEGETARRMTAEQAAVSEALAAREAALDEMVEQLDAEWENLAKDRERVTAQAHRLARQRAEAEAAAIVASGR